MTVIARIVDDNLLVHYEFVTLIEVEKATADGLYNLIVNFFIENNIPYKQNMIGYAGDCANDGQNSLIGYKFIKRHTRFIYNEMYMPLVSFVCFIFVFKITTVCGRFCKKCSQLFK